LVKPFASLLAGRFDTPSHRLGLDLFEEEDQLMVHQYRNLWVHLFFSHDVAHRILKRHDAFHCYDDASFRLMDHYCAEKCRVSHANVFLGKPLCSSAYFNLWFHRYPNAKFIICYRAPLHTIKSLIGLVDGLDIVSPKDFTQFIVNHHLVNQYQSIIDSRTLYKDDPRVFMLKFEDYKRSATACIDQISTCFGLPQRETVSPLKKQETTQTPESGQTRALNLLRDHWDDRWCSIYSQLPYESPF